MNWPALVFLLLLPACTLFSVASFSSPQREHALDPAEPSEPLPAVQTVLSRAAGAISHSEIDEPGMGRLVESLVACKTRSTLSSWTDPARGIGCARNAIVARTNEIAAASAGKLQIVVDKFDASSGRTNNKPAHLENVYAILPGSDAALSKTVFIVSGHFDSRASDVMDPALDAPGADDDASGTAVSLECARLLSRAGADARGPYRATLIFAAVSGEEQGLLGASHFVEWIRQQGYTVGGMLDNDIVGADFAPGGPHRVRLFSGGGSGIDNDSPSRELARAIEEVDGIAPSASFFLSTGSAGQAIICRSTRQACRPARFTEPLENYNHEHQTLRAENGIEYGDEAKYLNYQFMGDVARDNAEALRQLALAPAPPYRRILSGGVTPRCQAQLDSPRRRRSRRLRGSVARDDQSSLAVYDFRERQARQC